PCEGSSACAPPGRTESSSRSAGEAQASEERPPATNAKKAARPYGFPSGSGSCDNGVRPAGRRDPEVRPATLAGKVEARAAGGAGSDHEPPERDPPLAAAAGPEHEHVAAAPGEAAGDERQRRVLRVLALQRRLADRLPGSRLQRQLARGRVVRKHQEDD